jgi:hypothetical protein
MGYSRTFNCYDKILICSAEINDESSLKGLSAWEKRVIPLRVREEDNFRKMSDSSHLYAKKECMLILKRVKEK